jgi:hypothetical protein
MRANRAGGSVSISSSLATRVTHTGRDRASGDEPTREWRGCEVGRAEAGRERTVCVAAAGNWGHGAHACWLLPCSASPCC